MSAQELAHHVIDRLGGPTAVAHLFEPPISHAAVIHWRRAGIPPARLQLLRLMRPEVFEDVESPPAKASPCAVV